MSSHQAITPFLLAALCLATVPVFARAQTIPAACRPLIDARKKQIMTPNHSYMTEGPASPGGKATTHEGISTGGVTYIMYGGKWRRSPLSPQAMLVQLDSNLTTAKVYTCQHVSDESVAGVPAAVYTAHTDNEGVKADARIWVAKGSGLVLRTEEDVDTGEGDKHHLSIRYEYTNVRAPAGVQ